MLTFATKRTVQNIFIISAHKIFNESINLPYYKRLLLIKFALFTFQHMVFYNLFSTTSSIKPKDFAASAVIKLSLSKADFISSTDLPVCLE